MKATWRLLLSIALAWITPAGLYANEGTVPLALGTTISVASLTQAPPPPPPEAAPEGPAPAAVPATGGRALQLPDISFIGVGRGKLSSDDRDDDRNRVLLDEAEIGIQSYVYPGVRADAFITMPGHENFTAELEEAYLTHEALR
ncbi:MAG: hypothetical protein QHJ73_05345, partial [Armatimonadota bacterium]|nr:hypothetical protein [Armatimonadota bacterium]